MLFLSTVAWGQQDQRSHCSCWGHHCHPPQTWPERSSCRAHWWTPALTSGQASSSWLAIWSQTVFQSRVPVLLTAVSPVEHIVMNKVLNNPPLSLYPHLLWCSVMKMMKMKMKMMMKRCVDLYFNINWFKLSMREQCVYKCVGLIQHLWNICHLVSHALT